MILPLLHHIKIQQPVSEMLPSLSLYQYLHVFSTWVFSISCCISLTWSSGIVMSLERDLALFSSWSTGRCCSPPAHWSLQREAHLWGVQKPFVACLFCLQCNNPMTKEPKLQAAMRIVPEWQDYDQEIKLLQSHFQKEKEMGTPAEMPGQHTHGNLCSCTSVTFSMPFGLVLYPPSLWACTMHRAEWGNELNHQGV